MTDDLAKKAAQLSMQSLLTLPPAVRIAAVTMMLKGVLLTDIKAERRAEFFNTLVRKIGEDLGVQDGDAIGNKRGHRGKAARKKGRS